ncbi:MAG TPA: BTAD domain-containing putative transcriptional regulator, partial [Gemmatimonadales bacterium]
MIELSLLGLHALRGPDGRELTSLPAQPKRFALLAYLALGGDGGYHRRDSLVAVFWPEMDQFSARRALRNTLYHLREALGEKAIMTRGDEAVAINPAMLSCDVTRLQDAFAAGRYEEVVDGYRGELLAGIHFADAGEAYEEWLTRERSQILNFVMRALTRLVEREEAAGNLAAAAHWAQRACALDPRDEVRLRRAMTLLDRQGDNGSALRLYDGYAGRLDAEFKARPSAETAALATAIRSGGQPAAVDRTHAPRIDHAADPLPDTSTVVSVAAVAPPRPRRRRVISSLVAVGAIVVVGVVVRVMSAAPARSSDARKRVLVAVFDNRTGDTALQSLGRMTQDWLTQGILRTNLVDVVDPRAVFVQGRTAVGAAVDPVTIAHRTGAAMVISGSYFRTGDTLVYQAAVMDVLTGRVVRAVGPILSSARTPLGGLDELRSRVMSALASLVDARATQNLNGAGEVPTFDAYQAYVAGYDAFWHGDGRASKALFLEAAHRDTAFAAAGLAAAMAAANSNDCPLVDSLARSLQAGSRSLSQVDRLSLQIADARCRGRNEEMLRLTLERADLEPGNAGDQMSAAAAARWANRPKRSIELLQRINPAVDLAWSTDST